MACILEEEHDLLISFHLVYGGYLRIVEQNRNIFRTNTFRSNLK